MSTSHPFFLMYRWELGNCLTRLPFKQAKQERRRALVDDSTCMCIFPYNEHTNHSKVSEKVRSVSTFSHITSLFDKARWKMTIATSTGYRYFSYAVI